MRKDFQRLCDITATDIEPDKITNRNLKKIIDSSITQNGNFIFWSSKRNHSDSTGGEHTDSGTGDQHNDFSIKGYSDHTDHQDHTDYSENNHSDSPYNESSYHTDSDGSHSDYSERSHIDR